MYLYVDTVRPLLTIAGDTKRHCDDLWNGPLMATEFAYAARTTPVHGA